MQIKDKKMSRLFLLFQKLLCFSFYFRHCFLIIARLSGGFNLVVVHDHMFVQIIGKLYPLKWKGLKEVSFRENMAHLFIHILVT